MNVGIALIVTAVLIALPWAGIASANMYSAFGIYVPYAAVLLFIFGILYRVVLWARSPVPFRITTTSGQQRSLPWIKFANLESPANAFGVIGRMLLEVLFFRSLFRNTKAEKHNGPMLAYGSSKWLWFGAMAFHWSFLIIFIRHLRFFTEPVPAFIPLAQNLDGIFQIGVPVLYISDILIVAALSYLFIRRICAPTVRYISLAADYFPLMLIFAIASTGILMRYFTKVDIIAAKKLAISLTTFHPAIPKEGIGVIFYIHLFLVSALFAYFPFSKLAHMAGIFLSPTRNLANNSRAKRHVNPWNYPVKVHTYNEWEDEFRDRLKSAGYTLERE